MNIEYKSKQLKVKFNKSIVKLELNCHKKRINNVSFNTSKNKILLATTSIEGVLKLWEINLSNNNNVINN